MSRPSAIAAVTAVLHNVMARTIEGAEVTSLPPDLAREHAENKVDGTQLNLYLYQVSINPARRNEFSSFKSGSDASAPQNIAPLPLNLYYLLTAYGPSVLDDWESQRVLGEAMRLLNDQPLLDRERIRRALPASLRDSGLDEQVERIRFTPHQLSLDDMYKLWSGFQKPYRLSVAYEASAVLIDSDMAAHRARPVLTYSATVGTAMPPRLDAVRFPIRLKTSRGNFSPATVEIRSAGTPDRIVLIGEHLGGSAATVQFRSPDGTGIIERPAFVGPDGIVVELSPKRPAGAAPRLAGGEDHTPIAFTPEFDADSEGWHPGFYAVTFVAVAKPADRNGSATLMRSNALPIPVAPHIVGAPTFNKAGDDFALKCEVEPPVRRGQRLTAIVGQASTSVVAQKDADTLEFTIPRADLKSGKSAVRIRVDEVENLSIAPRKTPDGRVLPVFGSDTEVGVP